MTTPEEGSDKPAVDKNGASPPPDAQPLPKPFFFFVLFAVLYLFLLSPFWAGQWWSDKVTSWRGLIVAAVAILVFYFAGILIFDRVRPGQGKYRKLKVAENLKTAKKSIAPAAYGLACFFLIFFAMVYLWANPLTLDEARSNVSRALPPIGRGAVVACLVAIVVLSHALVSNRYTGGTVSAFLHLDRASERLRQLTGRSQMVSLIQYGLPILIIASMYFWADLIFASRIVDFVSLHQRYAIVVALFGAYFLGGMIRVLQGHYRIFVLPFYGTASLLLLLILVIAFSGDPAHMNTLLTQLGTSGPWALVALVAVVVLGPLIRPLLRRVQKAELPGGMKFELGEIDKVQQSVSPWRKTVTRFDDLIQSVAELIEDTPNDEVVRFLAYTPALGFLTLAETEWERLHRLLVWKRNIQITCLLSEDLEKWHGQFNKKPTHRSVEGRQINQEMIEAANKVSKQILDLKRTQRNPRALLAQIEWKKLPGYYLFANNKRAIIATPLFLPDNLEGTVQNDGRDFEDTPVTILGFESTDNWTVWLVHKVCDRYMDKASKSKPSTSATGSQK